MQKLHKDLLRGLVATLRHTLAGAADTTAPTGRGDLDRELERLGFAPDGTITALDALPHPTPHEIRAYRVAEAQLAGLDKAARIQARQELIERAAYSWINRLLALRTMEARGLIGETLRANPDYDGIPEALFILRAMQPKRSQGPDGGWWAVVEDACAAQARLLPGLFDLDDPNVALRPSVTALLRCVQALGAPRLDAVMADPDVVGWAYQFYQEEAKTQVYAKLGSGGKVESRAEIAAATQLFTEPYMVKWLLQNSLGRSYAEAYPASALPAGWEYYIDREKLLGETQETGSGERPRFTLDELTVMDPCMGSGHFLREAFDMLVAMQREQHPGLDPSEIAGRVLSRHLYGVDIDPRAAQLAGLTLILRAWEQVRQAKGASVTYTPSRLNLATTPKLPAGALDRHLARYADDAIYRPVLAKLFEALEQAPVLGSLLRPEEHLDAAMDALMTPNKRWQPALLSDDREQQAALLGIQSEERAALKARLLERLGASFAKEAADADVSAQLLGREASEGVHLVQLLSRKYAVVATNPPYMGSGNMDAPLRRYVESHYKPGDADLYAAFILRCLSLSYLAGRVAMVTRQGWLFDKGYTRFRATPDEQQRFANANTTFLGILRDTDLENLAHLGANAFEEISGEVVKAAMFIIRNLPPGPQQRTTAFRLTSLDSPDAKASQLRADTAPWRSLSFHSLTSMFLMLQSSPVAYWLPRELFALFRDQPPIGRGENGWIEVRDGINTGDNSRFIRFVWEARNSRWCKYSKGGGYAKWGGLEYFILDWYKSGERIKNAELQGTAFRNIDLFFRPALCYSLVAQGALGVRFADDTAYDGTGLSVQSRSAETRESIAAILNCRLVSYFVRLLSQDVKFRGGYVERIPQPKDLPTCLAALSKSARLLKRVELAGVIYEPRFDAHSVKEKDIVAAASVLRHTIEGASEYYVFTAYGITSDVEAIILAEIGTPAGWHPLISGYDSLPDLPDGLDLPSLPQEVLDYLARHERIAPSADELARIKANLQALYEAGPGAKADDLGLEELDHHDDEDEGVAGAYIPIPTETFLEELSVKLQIHPISVYRLLEELRREGVRCKPEEKRLLEDRLSVLVLRLLGHRWPKQIEAGEAVPPWADRDGVIPLTPGTGEATLAERLRARLRDEESDLGAQRVEALLMELTGRSLEEWLRRDFFKRHVSQFKKRPIAWQVASDPTAGGRKRSSPPAFECMVYYHRTAGDILARIRTRYVEPLIQAERGRQYQARQGTLAGVAAETAEAQATATIRELEEFAARLRAVEESGFACADLEKYAAQEPLDRWSGDGVLPPASRAAFLAHEQGWHVDINDGVRVNVAPLQAAGLLAADVLAKKDLPKAVADRARWRSDERRWVRQGKLPRCGWMGDDVPESPQWTALAPEREKERLRLEEKRQKVLAELRG